VNCIWDAVDNVCLFFFAFWEAVIIIHIERSNKEKQCLVVATGRCAGLSYSE